MPASPVTASPVTAAHQGLLEALDRLRATMDARATDDELFAVLRSCAAAARRADVICVDAIATLTRRGAFTERGYRSSTNALTDLMGCEPGDARRRGIAAEQVRPRIGLDAQMLAPRLPATAAAFDTGEVNLRHVEVIAQALNSPAAARLTPAQWTDVEAELADNAPLYPPKDLLEYATTLIDTLDHDGAEPDDREPPAINELYLHRRDGASGGTIKGRFDDAAMFDAIATAIDALAKPVDSQDDRTVPGRQADALADICGYVLDHGEVPQCGGHRPHLNVLIDLADLENRARHATLDFGGTLTADVLRMLACDAAVIPIVLGGAGQPLDVGRATRTIPDGLRRAVYARDHGCARCGRPPSWCEIHHIIAWEQGGETKLSNCTMLCRRCHHLIHHSGWTVQLHNGIPEFIPPKWIDPQQNPRRRP